jgi:hypothetical protein
MFKKILQALLFKEICQITVQQTFPIYRIDTETYTVIFLENLLERKVKVEGSKILERANLWIGTEFYVLTILPWLNNLMTNKELREHLTLVRDRCGNYEKISRKTRDNNVIELSRWISSRSTEDQYEV